MLTVNTILALTLVVVVASSLWARRRLRSRHRHAQVTIDMGPSSEREAIHDDLARIRERAAVRNRDLRSVMDQLEKIRTGGDGT